MKELHNLASQLWAFELEQLVASQLKSSITLENVVEAMFSGLPLPTGAIFRGEEIIRRSGNRSKHLIHTQLRGILVDAVDGSRRCDRDAVLKCLDLIALSPLTEG